MVGRARYDDVVRPGYRNTRKAAAARRTKNEERSSKQGNTPRICCGRTLVLHNTVARHHGVVRDRPGGGVLRWTRDLLTRFVSSRWSSVRTCGFIRILSGILCCALAPRDEARRTPTTQLHLEQDNSFRRPGDLERDPWLCVPASRPVCLCRGTLPEFRGRDKYDVH